MRRNGEMVSEGERHIQGETHSQRPVSRNHMHLHGVLQRLDRHDSGNVAHAAALGNSSHVRPSNTRPVPGRGPDPCLKKNAVPLA